MRKVKKGWENRQKIVFIYTVHWVTFIDPQET